MEPRPRSRAQFIAGQAVSVIVQLVVTAVGALWIADGLREAGPLTDVVTLGVVVTRLSVLVLVLLVVSVPLLPLMETDAMRKLRHAQAPQWIQLRRLLVAMYAGAFAVAAVGLAVGLLAG